MEHQGLVPDVISLVVVEAVEETQEELQVQVEVVVEVQEEMVQMEHQQPQILVGVVVLVDTETLL
jgi:hypothetical protein